MNRKQILIIAMAGIVTFCLGILLGKCLPAEKEEQISEQVAGLGQEDGQKEILQQSEAKEINIMVRINDGDVEWYDGIRWNRVGSAEELMKNDKYNMAEVNRLELEESLLMKRVEAVREESVFMSRENNELYVGKEEVPEAPSEQKPPAQKPPAQKPANQEQLPTETPAPSSSQTSTSEPDDSETPPESPDDEQPDDTPPSTPIETPAETPVEMPVEPPSDSGSQTGDGENMEWSDDYL